MLVTTNIPVAEAMTQNVVKVNPFTTMDEVKAIFDQQGFHHIPVVDQSNKIIGIISREDLTILSHNMTIFNRAQEKEFNEKFLTTVYVKEAMTKQVITLQMEDTLRVAAEIFSLNQFHALPVVDKKEEVVGILTTYDLIKYAYF